MVEILEYTDRSGRSPFARWFVRLRDEAARAAVLIRLRRLALGLAGDAKSVGAGVFELRVHIGPGTEATQATDIVTARQCLVAHRGVKH